jgi:hypothetical protein
LKEVRKLPGSSFVNSSKKKLLLTSSHFNRILLKIQIQNWIFDGFFSFKVFSPSEVFEWKLSQRVYRLCVPEIKHKNKLNQQNKEEPCWPNKKVSQLQVTSTLVKSECVLLQFFWFWFCLRIVLRQQSGSFFRKHWWNRHRGLMEPQQQLTGLSITFTKCHELKWKIRSSKFCVSTMELLNNIINKYRKITYLQCTINLF